MKAASGIVSAVVAAVMSVGIVTTGGFVSQVVSATVAHAAVVSRIEVRGNRRVDYETIVNYVAIKPGVAFSGADIDEAVKRLFATGLFADVRITQAGGTLVVEVQENAVVNQVLFQGNKKIKDEQLSNIVQLKPRGTYSPDQLEVDAEAVREAYRRIGRDDATVSTQVIDLGDSRVNVVFEIQEGGRTKIATINFVGNNAFSDRRLSDVIATKRSNILSFLMRNDVFDEDRLRADEELLRRFYYNRGYADFRIISAVGEIDESENEYIVTFTVEEGDRYDFGPIEIENTIEGVDPESLRGLVESREGRVYSAKEVEDSIIALTERMAGMGYAFAQVTPRGDRNFEARTIAVVYSIEEGSRVYIERIEIRGNTRTRDYVIRREFDLSEGDAFNQVMVQRAKRRLEALDFFETVEISTVPGAEPDQIVLVVDLVEKSTGEFSVGAGYSTGATNTRSAGINIEAAVSEKNFLGRGQYIKLSVSGGMNARDFQLSFTEPYFLGRRISAGFDLFRQTRDYDNYDTKLIGGSVRFGLPITEALTTQFAYNLTQEEYNFTSTCDVNGDGVPDVGCFIAPAIVAGINASPWIKSSVSGTVLFNTIDDMKNPRSGIYALATVEVAGLGGNAKFVKATARGSYYHTLSDEFDIVGLITVGAGHVQGFGGGGLRVFDMFQSTDRIIRGFEYGGMGPVDAGVFREALGGTTYFHASAEAQFPLPVIPETYGLKGAIFADAATLYGNNLVNVLTASSSSFIRASAGISLIWASPFGPLRVDYSVPLRKLPTDRVQNFNFGMSTRF
ncbi:MAG: outer membrane protein assembly factor BamA [Rhizobiaceae bacterium]